MSKYEVNPLTNKKVMAKVKVFHNDAGRRTTQDAGQQGDSNTSTFFLRKTAELKMMEIGKGYKKI